VVDRSLETLAADRGVTICFAALDGVDGLWLPDERTILVSSQLGDRRAAEVLEHELTHVAIEDGHAALDAAVRRRGGRTRLAVVSTAAACLVLLVGIRLQAAGHPTGDLRQQRTNEAGHTAAPPQTGQPRPPSRPPAMPATKVVPQVFNPDVRTQTVTVLPPPVTPSPSPSPRATPSGTSAGPAGPTGPMTTPTQTTSAPPPTTVTPEPTAAGTPTPTPSPSVPAATAIQLPAQQ
jgi:hypothetical protein